MQFFREHAAVRGSAMGIATGLQLVVMVKKPGIEKGMLLGVGVFNMFVRARARDLDKAVYDFAYALGVGLGLCMGAAFRPLIENVDSSESIPASAMS